MDRVVKSVCSLYLSGGSRESFVPVKIKNQSLNLTEIKVAPSFFMVSHLLFTYDSLLFFKVNRVGAFGVKEVLQIYCDTSSQQLPFAKGVQNSMREAIMDTLQVHNARSSK
jgi:hypothetical protein